MSQHLCFAAGAGVGIRINDDGIDASHPDLSANFDVASSCDNYLPFTLDSKNSHGTTCAALAAAGGNSVCSVGMAPDASLSGCRIFNEYGGFDQEAIAGYSYLYVGQENVAVSSNSYGDDACYTLPRRRLQGGTCPFSQDSEYSPCADKSACFGEDWASPNLSPLCEADIVNYCSVFYETDVEACISYLDLFVSCEYNAQNPEEADALVQGVMTGRGGKGIVYMYAAGNEFDIGEDINFEGSLNSRFTIT